jgi:hypothetical protein
MWKGLISLGSMFSTKKDKPKYLTREEQKKIRKQINPHKLCGLCLNEYEHQAKDGTMLCEVCYQERKKDA